MEWYRNARVDDVIVPNDQCTPNSIPSQEKWNQMDSVDSLDYTCVFGNSAADEGDFSCETLVEVDRNEMDCLIDKGDQAEFSGVPGGISESSNCWTSFLNNQDYQLDEFPWTNQTDENFMNSVLVDDLCAGDQFPIYDSPKSQGAYSTVYDLPSNMLLESHDVESYDQMVSPKFPYTFGWNKEQPDASCHDLQNIMISSAPPLENDTFSEDPSVEETVLQELGSAVRKMNNKTRLCFRDAMYRLATNSEKHSRVLQSKHISLEKPFRITLPDQTFRFRETDAMEQRTNSIDRTVADLLFNKPYQHGDYHQHLGLEAKPHKRCPPKPPAFIMGR